MNVNWSQLFRQLAEQRSEVLTQIVIRDPNGQQVKAQQGTPYGLDLGIGESQDQDQLDSEVARTVRLLEDFFGHYAVAAVLLDFE